MSNRSGSTLGEGVSTGGVPHTGGAGSERAIVWLSAGPILPVSIGPGLSLSDWGYHSERSSTSLSVRALFAYWMIRSVCFKGTYGVRGKALIGISGRELSRREGAGRHLVTRERLPLIFLALGVICGPFLLTILLTVILLLFLYFLGLAGTAVAAAVFLSSAYISYAVLLPLAAMRAIRSREQKQKITNEMITFFSTKIIALYSASEATPGIAEDPRMAEAFTLYSQANRLLETVQNPLNVCETVERGVALIDELMADYRTSN